jgi:hypothetical protein
MEGKEYPHFLFMEHTHAIYALLFFSKVKFLQAYSPFQTALLFLLLNGEKERKREDR